MGIFWQDEIFRYKTDMLHTISPTLSALSTELYATMTTVPSVAGRVHDIIPGSVMVGRQPIEYKVFLRLLHLSEHTPKDKEEIMNQDVICYSISGTDDWDRSNLIVYTIDTDGRVTRWGCYYKNFILDDNWELQYNNGAEKSYKWTIEDFDSALPKLVENWFEFIPPWV